MHLVMFDIDGTLVDSTGFDGELFAETVKEEVGVAVDLSWQSYDHVTDRGILEQVLLESVAEAQRPSLYRRVQDRFVAKVREFIRVSPERAVAIPGAPELVRALREKPSVVVAFATGGWRETAEAKLRSAGIEFEGSPFLSSSDVAARVEIMQLAEERAAAPGRSFSCRTYFGDGPWDQKASLQLGYDFVAVGAHVEHMCRFEDLRNQKAIFEVLDV